MMGDHPADIFERNRRYAQPLRSFQSELRPDQEQAFRQWVATNKVPFDPEDSMSDYDMRAYWRDVAAQGVDQRSRNGNDGRMHFPDTYKTPYHQSFSDESTCALPGAPSWINDHQLALPDGSVVFDERPAHPKRRGH